ncbi:MAG: carbohydrate ABC transporter permease [Lachnospiraceae bacterium]|nr:carbohydrate ABC transporter permease [Lachnospiraceae bacterium]
MSDNTNKKKVKEHVHVTPRLIISYIVLAILTFLCLFFFYILIINSTRSHIQIQQGFSFLPGGHFQKNFLNVINDAKLPILIGLKNSLIVSTCAAVLSCYFSALTAYGLYAYDFKLKKAAVVFILLILVMPTQVSALGFIQLITKINLMDTLLPLFLPSIAAPAVFYFMYSYMQSSLPMELLEAARIDGCSEFKTFNKIVLPIMKPALAVQAIFVFVSNWNNFFMPALVISSNDKKTLPILIASLRSADFLKFDMGKIYMFILLAIVPIIIVYILLSKYIVAGVTLGGVKE